MGELIWQRLLKVQIVLYFVNWLEKSAEYKKQYEKMEKYSRKVQRFSRNRTFLISFCFIKKNIGVQQKI